MKKILGILMLGMLAVVPALPQDSDGANRGVARLSLLSGDVSVRRGDTGEWVSAAVNAPLLTDDRVLTGVNSRAEVQLDYANFARLSGRGELRLADIENRKYLVRLAQGTMTYRVLRNLEADVEISTPSVAVRPLRKGVYRVTVLEDGTTEVTVRSGEADIYTPRGSQKLRSGRTLLARGSANDPEFRTVASIDFDDWDRWNESRDRDLERSQSYNYVSRDITGAEDLDRHGRWVDTPEYGMVWTPNTSAGWAPYRYGRWNWVDYYGWNWVSYDPWGWAPYHYGRWFFRANTGWCWWPGSIRSRHFWSPALVGFFGWGGGGFNVGIGVGFGNWGWVPLAPFETYYPWYGRGYYGGFRNRGFVNNGVNIVNNVNITNIYRNARVNNAVTGVEAGQFGRGSVNAVRFNQNDLNAASIVRGQLPLVPDAQSTRLSDRAALVRGDVGSSRTADRFYATRQPTNIDRVPFETQRAAMQEVSRRTFSEAGRGGEVAEAGRGARGEGRLGGSDAAGAVDNVRGSDSGRPGTATRGEMAAGESAGRGGDAFRGTVRGAEPAQTDRGGWRRLGDAGDANTGDPGGRGSMGAVGDTGNRGGANADTDRGGWRRFGEPAGSRGEATAGRGDSGNFGRGNVERAPSNAGQDRGSWRRFGDSTAIGGDQPAGRGGFDQGATRSDMGGVPVDRSGSMDRGRGGFGDNGATRGNTQDRNWNRGTFDRGSAERSNNDRGDTGNRGGFGSRVERNAPDFGRGSFPQMSPPVVRERSAPDFGSRGDRGGMSSPRMESPRMERSAPRMEMPRMERSAPRMEMPRMERSAPRMEMPRMERSAPSMPSGRGGGGEGDRGGGQSGPRGGGGRVR